MLAGAQKRKGEEGTKGVSSCGDQNEVRLGGYFKVPRTGIRHDVPYKRKTMPSTTATREQKIPRRRRVAGRNAGAQRFESTGFDGNKKQGPGTKGKKKGSIQ